MSLTQTHINNIIFKVLTHILRSLRCDTRIDIYDALDLIEKYEKIKEEE